MAELQYVINVKCINTKLAEIMIGELGDLIIVNISNSIFTPHELDKLIDATRIANDQVYKNRMNKPKETSPPDEINKAEYDISIIEKRKVWEIKILQSGELIFINFLDNAIAPSEFNDFIKAIKTVKNQATRLRLQNIQKE